MNEGLDRERVLRALDETPQTTDRLARTLDAEPDRVRTVLDEAREENLVVDWGDVWATSWRAKLKLSPGFFRVWLPASLGLGAGLTALALGLNAPEGVRWRAAGGLAVLAALAAVVAAVEKFGGGDETA